MIPEVLPSKLTELIVPALCQHVVDLKLPDRQEAAGEAGGNHIQHPDTKHCGILQGHGLSLLFFRYLGYTVSQELKWHPFNIDLIIRNAQ